MIIYESVDLKEVLKKRSTIPGNVLKHVPTVTLRGCGAMDLFMPILMELAKDSGLRGTDALCAERLSACVPEVFSPGSRPL